MKRIAIHQAEFLPWKGFFFKLSMSDELIILDAAKYNKQDFQNRNRFRCDNRATWITVPVKKHADGTPISEIKIDNSTNWQRRIYRKLYEHYHNASFYESIIKVLSPLWNQEWDSLLMLNYVLINEIATYLGIKTKVTFSTSYTTPSLLIGLTATEKNILLTKHAQGTSYLAGPCAANYENKQLYIENNLKYEKIHYTFSSTHIHYSIVDALFNSGPSIIDEINQYGAIS